MSPILAAALTLSASAAVHGQQPAGIAQVRWLEGCWEAASAQRTIEEHWMAPHGGSMLGMSRTVRGGVLTEQELILLREQGNGLAYEAHPSRQAVTVFASAGVSDTLVLFENPEHDFPQRVGYRRIGADSLLAWIEGVTGGETRRIEFRYRRAACPGS